MVQINPVKRNEQHASLGQIDEIKLLRNRVPGHKRPGYMDIKQRNVPLARRFIAGADRWLILINLLGKLLKPLTILIDDSRAADQNPKLARSGC